MKCISKYLITMSHAATPLLHGYAASAKYQLTVVNGGLMPLSHGVLYASNAGAPLSGAGVKSTPGFIKLCQTGQHLDRLQELKLRSDVTEAVETDGLIFPGEKKTFEIKVQNINKQVIHFEAMYGLTKDACAKITVGPHTLYALAKHVTPADAGKDNVIVTGAFQSPVLPNEDEADICTNSTTAISCLRELALPMNGDPKGRFLPPYSSSLVTFLEKRYGANEVQPLLLSTSGAVQYLLTLKH